MSHSESKKSEDSGSAADGVSSSPSSDIPSRDAAAVRGSSEEFTSFAPFEAEKVSRLRYKGSDVQPRIHISTARHGGINMPAVIFRKLRTPTPTPPPGGSDKPAAVARRTASRHEEQAAGAQAGGIQATGTRHLPRNNTPVTSGKHPGKERASTSSSGQAAAPRAREGRGGPPQPQLPLGSGAGTGQGQAAVILGRMLRNRVSVYSRPFAIDLSVTNDLQRGGHL